MGAHGNRQYSKVKVKTRDPQDTKATGQGTEVIITQIPCYGIYFAKVQTCMQPAQGLWQRCLGGF